METYVPADRNLKISYGLKQILCSLGRTTEKTTQRGLIFTNLVQNFYLRLCLPFALHNHKCSTSCNIMIISLYYTISVRYVCLKIRSWGKTVFIFPPTLHLSCRISFRQLRVCLSGFHPHASATWHSSGVKQITLTTTPININHARS